MSMHGLNTSSNTLTQPIPRERSDKVDSRQRATTVLSE